MLIYGFCHHEQQRIFLLLHEYIPSHGYNPTESIPRVKQKIGWIMNVKTQSAHKDIVFVGTWTFSKLLVFLGDKRDVQMIEKGARRKSECAACVSCT